MENNHNADKHNNRIDVSIHCYTLDKDFAFVPLFAYEFCQSTALLLVSRLLKGIHQLGQAPQLLQHQADATLNQASPVSGTKYTVLDTTKNVRIISATAKVTWTVQPTPLEFHITIDGQTLIAQKVNPVSAAVNSLQNNTPDTANLGFGNSVAGYRAFVLEGRSVKIEAETTGGTVSNLSARVKYAKIP